MEIIKKALGALAAKMKQNKRLELIVYALLAALGILLYVSAVSDREAKPAQGISNSKETQTGGSNVEARLAEILSQIDGAGRVEVMIVGEEAVKGVIVVSEGAADIGVRLELESAVSTVLGIEKDDVNVFEMVREENANE